MVGNHPSYGGTLVETITADKQLTGNDSGKVFMCSQASAVKVNLPKLSANIAGWNAKFILSSASSNDFHIMGYGLGITGGTTGDNDVIYFTDMNSAGRLTTYTGSETKDFSSLSNDAEVREDVDVVGASLGDFAIASLGVDTADLNVTCTVTAADTATVVLENQTGGAVDLASTTLSVLVINVTESSRTDSTQDGVFFDASNAAVGDFFEIVTDGTSWFIHGHGSTSSGVDDVDS